MTESTEQIWTSIGPGYDQLELPSWKAFVDYVCNEMVDYQTYIWRGQRCDNWGLETTVDRLIKKTLRAIQVCCSGSSRLITSNNF